ncbi:type VI secretion system TssO [Xanthocytophaga flava]|uniref:type VI secretion system TssO n=1 Tax=Xanthocytophaga flava TaxID=3048013 RepID=UPI0028D8502F|nr:type VI secretion system TssO [Xanthocytophaga flavus]MDJ1469680.1 type VI secretion system TssO [Xanthocytophaga flavus]
MPANVNLTRKERRMSFLNLLLIYLIAMSALAFLLFKNSFMATSVDYKLSKRKLEEGKAFQKQQQEAAEFINQVNSRILQMSGNTRQIFLERDIQRSIKDLRSYYDPGNGDLREVGFTQAASFLTMQYEDKLVLAKTNQNLLFFEKQLGDCEIGFKQKQDLLNQKKLMENSRIGNR